MKYRIMQEQQPSREPYFIQKRLLGFLWWVDCDYYGNLTHLFVTNYKTVEAAEASIELWIGLKKPALVVKEIDSRLNR
jgi:hypothetical protein